jgi:hypothetical protein
MPKQDALQRIESHEKLCRIMQKQTHDRIRTCDLTAVAYGKPSIVDWKQSNRPKKEEWVEDYKLQLGAYYLAHTTNYGPIEQGVISICTRDLQYQEFRLSEADLEHYGGEFLKRLDQFNKLQQPAS